MNRDVLEVQVRAVLPLDGSFAVFLGNQDKTFVIYVEESVGSAITMFMRGVTKERPLTHDLLASVLLAFGAHVERIVINTVQGTTFFARLILSAENELHTRKVIEIDARPSDCIALAIQQNAPIFVAESVWESVQDVTSTLEEIEQRSAEEAQASGEDLDDPFDDDDDDDLLDDEDDLEADEDILEALDLGKITFEDEDSEDTTEDKGYDDGYTKLDDDDDEGEEWKKGGQ